MNHIRVEIFILSFPIEFIDSYILLPNTSRRFQFVSFKDVGDTATTSVPSGLPSMTSINTITCPDVCFLGLNLISRRSWDPALKHSYHDRIYLLKFHNISLKSYIAWWRIKPIFLAGGIIRKLEPAKPYPNWGFYISCVIYDVHSKLRYWFKWEATGCSNVGCKRS